MKTSFCTVGLKLVLRLNEEEQDVTSNKPAINKTLENNILTLSPIHHIW